MRTKQVPRLVLTGPPGGGKTDGQKMLAEKLPRWGIRVVTVPEVDTLVHQWGIDTAALISHPESAFIYELNVLKVQLALENALLAMAWHCPQDKIVLVCDRGNLDDKIYLGPEVFGVVLSRLLGITEEELLRRYFAVFHLVTAAQGAEKFYNKKRNPRRTETPEQARQLEAPTRAVWSAHPYRRVIENFQIGPDGQKKPISFDAKMAVLFKEVCLALSQFYGELIGPVPSSP